MRIKNDEYYLLLLEKDVNFIIDKTKKISEKSLKNDEVLLDSMMFRLIQISESIKKLSNAIKEKYNEVPWLDIMGFRNRIVHDYGRVDFYIVIASIKCDIPVLKEFIDNIKSEMFK